MSRLREALKQDEKMFRTQDRIRFDFGDYIRQTIKWGSIFLIIIVILGGLCWVGLFWFLNNMNRILP